MATTTTPRLYYAVNRYLVVGNGEDTPFETIDTQYECFWSLEGAQASMRRWHAKGWSVELDGPHESPANCDTSKVRP